MRRARFTRWAALLGLATLAANAGCTHYHYYGAPPTAAVACDPAVPGTTVVRRPALIGYGSVCEVPPAAGGTVVSEAPRRGDLVVSTPQGAGPAGRRRSGLAWRRPDPENLATTRVEGGLDDSTLR